MNWAALILYISALASVCDPYGLEKDTKRKYVREIIRQAEHNHQDPYELLAIAITESSLNPSAYSHTKDVGLFQVNCKWWYKKFRYKNIKHCETEMLKPYINISKGIYILNSFRNNYKQCRGNLAYRCYNGGQGWPRSKNKDKILNYGKKIGQRKEVLHKYYKELIETIRSEFKTRI
jgi:soluble lytic murein transglycosylase-like protein